MKVRRGLVQDVFVEDGRCAVFVNNQVFVLSEIATFILEATPAESTATLDRISRDVVEEFGDPGPGLDAVEATRRQMLDLVAHKILVDAGSFAHEPFSADSVGALRSALGHLASDEPSRWQLPDELSSRFIGAVRLHRLAPALAQATDRLDLPAQIASQLVADYESQTATVRRQATELHEMISALERAGIRALTFKGLALAAQAHGDFTARGQGDHDLLVHPSDLTRAHATLTSLGWVPSQGFARPGSSWAWRHLVRNYYELPLMRGESCVDLHWHLGPVRAAFPSFDELWSRRATVSVGEGDVPTFSPYDALAHSAMHAAKDGWKSLRSLLDVHRLMSHPRTWRNADRELRLDQLLSVGLAAHLLGAPAHAPEVVHEAAQRASAIADRAVERQSCAPGVEISRRIPGASLVSVFAGLIRAGARPGDLWRHASLTSLPVTDFSGDPARHAVVAVPRALARRAGEVGGLWARGGSAWVGHASRTRESGHVQST